MERYRIVGGQILLQVRTIFLNGTLYFSKVDRAYLSFFLEENHSRFLLSIFSILSYLISPVYHMQPSCYGFSLLLHSSEFQCTLILVLVWLIHHSNACHHKATLLSSWLHPQYSSPFQSILVNSCLGSGKDCSMSTLPGLLPYTYIAYHHSWIHILWWS